MLGLEADWTIYKSAEYSYNRLVTRTIRQHYQDKLQSDTDPTKMWIAINELMNKPKKDTEISELRIDDNELIDLTQIPNAFNKYFIELGDELCNGIPPSVTIPEDCFADFECPANK